MPIKNQKSKIKAKSQRPPFTWREAALVSILVLAASCVGITLAADAAFDPARDAEQTLLDLADDYYTEYIYPTTLGYDFRNPEATLSEYQYSGFSTIYLYQLILHQDDTEKATKPFDNGYYRCNRNESTIRIFPVAPYGPRDYRVEYNLKCTKLPR